MANNNQVLLSVQHLEQFFKMGNKQLKAVNDVSFDIYKGEVFGLVGESGCGIPQQVAASSVCTTSQVARCTSRDSASVPASTPTRKKSSVSTLTVTVSLPKQKLRRD
ncbi:MAG: hypothetical protein IKC47_01890 [Clostridia bacterium]|nr:hypothetical protein [Clostridia bacterium]